MQLCRGPTAFNHLKPLNQSNSLHLATSDLSTLGGTSPQVARGCDCHWHSRAPHWLKCTACWPIKAMKLLHITGMCSDAWYIFYTYLCTYSRSNMEWGLNIHACTTCVMHIFVWYVISLFCINMIEYTTRLDGLYCMMKYILHNCEQQKSHPFRRKLGSYCGVVSTQWCGPKGVQLQRWQLAKH